MLVAGNFGQSLLAAPAMAAKIELSTEQKRHIASAIDQLESNISRSTAEEMAPNILKAILPERLPTQTRLLANYPNPFNPETWIPFELSQDTKVIVTIYDVQGNSVCQLELGMIMAGKYVTADQATYWDGKGETGETVASGTYFYQLRAGDYTEIEAIRIKMSICFSGLDRPHLSTKFVAGYVLCLLLLSLRAQEEGNLHLWRLMS
ncbi:hypothetical protein CMK12_02110 [Candidatus Poribacteria bacterium]|nr:hypothetical protein [Candidatus Poribacteria bacterium]MDP6594470.1 T9SS type A sorting domain-containing protein [Candidatus Poribacteria bacterium]MDP6750857.1 T9SS type A sorting domain-containing protein [Candidatus Poribacteria bacterium]MDP6997042.1 T9SS type A sorting domain-containing protein [Candidatus Poribacteria bacterium]